MKNNKGFTMVELLVTIIILGILSVVLIISMRSVLSSGRSSYYSSQENLVVLSGKDYFTSNKSKLPEGIGESTTVSLKTLIDLKYIDPVLDKNKEDCDYEESYVKVTKIAKSKYKYQVYLSCSKDDYAGDEIVEEEGNGDITFTANPVSGISNTKVTVTLKTIDKVNSYDYKVVKNGNTLYSQKPNETASQLKFEFTEEGTYQITVDYRVPGQGKLTKVSNTYIIDMTKPTCGTATSTDNTWKETNAPWTKNNRTIKVACSDTLTGCVTPNPVQQLFDKSRDDGYIVIQDKAGNTRDCKVSVRVDKDVPKCVSSGGSTEWAKALTLKGTCTDDHSGCKESSITLPFAVATNRTNVSPGTVYDNVGHSTVCPGNQTVKVDPTPPTCSISVISGTAGENGWYRSAVGLKLTYNDAGGSAVAGYGITTSTTETYNSQTTVNVAGPTTGTTYYGYVKDGAGNTVKCSTTVKIDSTAPNCGTKSGEGSVSSWTNGTRTVSVGCTESGGSSCAQTTFSYPFTVEGTSGIITIKDKAGNPRDCAVNTYIDKTKPTKPTISNPSGGKWVKAKFALTLGSTDARSGISYYQYSYDKSSWSNYSNSASTSFKTTDFSVDRNQSVYIRSVDKAGNPSDVSDTMIKLDTTNPYTPYHELNKLFDVEGSMIKRNYYGDCDLACYNVDKVNRKRSITLSQNDDKCYRDWARSSTSTTLTSARSSAHSKHYACGGTKITYEDQPKNGVASGHNYKMSRLQGKYCNTSISGCSQATTSWSTWSTGGDDDTYIKKCLCKVSITQTKSVDNAGNESAVYTYEALNNFFFSTDIRSSCKVSNNSWTC